MGKVLNNTCTGIRDSSVVKQREQCVFTDSGTVH